MILTGHYEALQCYVTDMLGQASEKDFPFVLEDLEGRSEPCYEEGYCWIKITEEEEKKTEESFEVANKEKGRKVFVGKINNGTPTLSLATLLQMICIMSTFGVIECVRYNLSKQYCFIVFERIANARTVIRILTKHQNRCSFLEVLKSYLEEQNNQETNLLCTTALPQANFYCRIPKDATTKKNKKKRKGKPLVKQAPEAEQM